MAIFADVNSNFEIQFSLDLIPDTEEVTFRIATTLAFAGGRPQVTLNEAESDAPSAPSKIDSRGITRGAYRGYGEVYTYSFGVDELVTGDNSIYISVISGSSGEEFLSPNFVSILLQHTMAFANAALDC
jgi:rhamnogalacturonan endolyase